MPGRVAAPSQNDDAGVSGTQGRHSGTPHHFKPYWLISAVSWMKSRAMLSALYVELATPFRPNHLAHHGSQLGCRSRSVESGESWLTS